MIFEGSQLLKKFEELDNGNEYIELIDSVCKMVEKPLEDIELLFGDYTDHG